MKTSCIEHPENEPLLVIRTWQIAACDGNHCAAALLSFFEYWHNIKLEQQGQALKANRIAEMHSDEATQDTSLLQFHNTEELQAGILDLYGRKIIEKSLTLLLEKGFISLHNNPNPRYHFDKTRYILFHPEHVNLYLKTEKVPDRSGKNALLYGKNALPYGKNALPIPEISSETSPEKNSPTPLERPENFFEPKPGEQIHRPLEEQSVCSGEESAMSQMPVAEMTQHVAEVTQPPLTKSERCALLRGVWREWGMSDQDEAPPGPQDTHWPLTPPASPEGAAHGQGTGTPYEPENPPDAPGAPEPPGLATAHHPPDRSGPEGENHLAGGSRPPTDPCGAAGGDCAPVCVQVGAALPGAGAGGARRSPTPRPLGPQGAGAGGRDTSLAASRPDGWRHDAGPAP